MADSAAGVCCTCRGPSDPEPSLYLNTRIFLAGLMDWSGDEPPTAQAIAGCKLLEQGRAHVAAITDTGGKILGHRDLELDGLPGLLQVPHRGGGTVWLYGAEDASAPQPARSGRPCSSCQCGAGRSSCCWPKGTWHVASHDAGWVTGCANDRIAAIEDVHPQCGRELCALACVNMSGSREPGRSSGDGFPRAVVTSPPTGG